MPHDMPIRINQVRAVFDEAFDAFLTNEVDEILDGISERNSCGRLALYLQNCADGHNLTGYFADPEYNRKQGGEIKTILDGNMAVIRINCDLILHSRGESIAEDNLVAIEMKKMDRLEREKESDRHRLRALTKSSYDDVWSNDGTTHPEHVCGYKLGVFIVLDRVERMCHLEYYSGGQKTDDCQHTI